MARSHIYMYYPSAHARKPATAVRCTMSRSGEDTQIYLLLQCYWARRAGVTAGSQRETCAAMFSDTLCKAQLESRFVFKVCWFFDPCHPGWLPFRFIFGSIFDPFWRPLGSILHHFGGFWRPLGVPGGVLGGGMVFHWFLEAKMVAKWSPRGSQNPFKMGSKFHCFFDPFLDAFWVPKWRPNRSLKRSKSIKKWIKI